MKRILFSMLLLGYGLLVAQQTQKKPITHDVYDSWKKIAGESISANGQWVAYTLEPQEGDASLVLFERGASRYDTIPRGTGAKFTMGSDYCAFQIKPFYKEIRKARIDKKKGPDQPKDSLGIMRLSDRSIVTAARVASFKLPEKGSGWIAYLLEKDLAPADSAKKKEAKKADTEDAADDDKDKKDEKGSTLVARELATGKDTTFRFVSEYVFSKNGARLLFSSTGNDSTVKSGVFCFDTKTRVLDTLASGKGKYKQLAFDEEGTQAAFVADRDTSKAKQRYYSVYLWSRGDRAATLIADTNTAGLGDRWLISEHYRPNFSKNGGRLYIGTAPVPMPEDTTLIETETAKLDVWNYQDPLLQTQQMKNVDEEKKRSYTAVVHLKKRRFVQLADELVPTVTVGTEWNADAAIGLSGLPYRQLLSWDGDNYSDAYIVDPNTGARKMICEKVKGRPSLSPDARYAVWYDESAKHWFTYGLGTEAITNISKGITVPLYNELNDIPDDPGPYGSFGWSEGDESVLLYDKYDIWSVDPSGKAAPVNVTRGMGRTTQTTFRYLRLDSEEKFVTPGQQLLLKTFNNVSKSAGYATTTLHTSDAPKQAYMAAAELSNPVKAKEADDLFFIQSSFTQAPEIYLSSLGFRTNVRISDTNPQQKDYNWGTVELVSWTAADGKPLDGLLYKPENFDPKRKYPMIVYFYERYADLLHRYYAPAPSASTISPIVYASNGYIVFIPDIRYETGYPGKGAMDAIVPGTLSMIARGFVDSSRVGIQGQSWGGYQVAYLVTHTHMFRAAGAGAAVTNMTSAYGGIRWESGMSRMFQYERSQSRIGATLWEKPLLYIENSPLFAAPYCTTPLLMMNNDADGAVPWYQGIEFFTALRRLGRPAWMLVYNNEAHNLVERKNRKDLSVRMMQFFDHYLKDAPMPVWMKTGIPAVNKGKTLGLEY